MAAAQPLGPLVGLVLAGGQSRRMGGGDKCLLPLAGRSLLEWVIEGAQPQVQRLVLNANGAPERFAGFGLEVIADHIPGYAGPLAGILTGLQWMRQHMPEARWLVSFASDAPFLPDDLVTRLTARLLAEDAEVACAQSGTRRHPVFALWPVALAEPLRHTLVDLQQRRIDRFTEGYRLAVASYGIEPFDPFLNINTAEDLATAEEIIPRWRRDGQ